MSFGSQGTMVLTRPGDEQRPHCTKCVRAHEDCEYGPVFRFRPSSAFDGFSIAPPTKRRNTGSRTESREVRYGLYELQISPLLTLEQITESSSDAEEPLMISKLEPPDLPPASSADNAVSDNGLMRTASHSSARVLPQDTLQSWPRDNMTSTTSTTTPLISPELWRVATRSSLASDSIAGSRLTGTPPDPAMAFQDSRLSHHTSPTLPQDAGSWAMKQNQYLSLQAMCEPSPTMDHTPASLSSGDGVFEPGSTYQTLYRTLRSHVFRTARSAQQSAANSPHIPTGHDETGDITRHDIAGAADKLSTLGPDAVPDDGGPVTPDLELEPIQDYLLWKAWTDEVSGWVSAIHVGCCVIANESPQQLDKFDRHQHFRNFFPVLARDNAHLKYAMLSLSSRSLEKKEPRIPPSLTLALYQHAIHLLLPKLYLRDIEVIASCVILCVLEMFSCMLRRRTVMSEMLIVLRLSQSMASAP
jgi:hypothetical protein